MIQNTRERAHKEFNVNKDITIKTLSDGRPYTIRLDRKRFFYPNEWVTFLKSLRPSSRPVYEFLFNTGARYDEAAHIRPMDFDFNRNNVRLWKTKTKAKKKEKQGKPRTVSLSTAYCKKVKRLCDSLPQDSYIYKQSVQAANQLLKKKLKKIGVNDYYNFSTHNIRKTHGMYLKALGIDIGEICTRLGHDYNTYIAHYGSADLFTDTDMRHIKELLDDLYMRQRRY